MTDELKGLINPRLLSYLVECRIGPPSEPLNIPELPRTALTTERFGSLIRPQFLPVLIALSKVGLETLTPEFLSTNFLPPPSSPDFPLQCLGLQLLVDQAPRALCRGIDVRWQAGYFDIIGDRFARWWHALPPEQRPDSWARWRDDVGSGFDYWTSVRLWFTAPFVHSEAVADHETALALTEETRLAVEEHSGAKDSWRERRDQVLSDLEGFPRVARGGEPLGENPTLEEWCWWWFMLFDTHKPIIDRFGRYPYRNGTLARASTPEEVEWLEQVGHYGETPSEVARQVKRDVERGIWQPLGEGKIEDE